MNKPMYQKILKYITKYDTIVIGRHVGADPDCLAGQIALRETIKLKFPTKKVYAVGAPASRFKFLGKLDRLPEDFNSENALAIIVDTPDRKRIDGVEVEKYAFSIKIDHHPFIEKTCQFELIDDKSSSTAQMIIEFIFEMKMPLNSHIAETLYAGLVSDTNRFLFGYTTGYTFELIAKLLNAVPVDLTKIYNHLYIRPLIELRFLGYIKQNITVTENGLAYIKLDNKILEEYRVDPATAGNMINELNYIKDFIVWVIFSEELKNDNIRVVLRSRGPIINDVLETYNGGGHHLAAGARIKTFADADDIIELLDQKCEEYNEENTK